MSRVNRTERSGGESDRTVGGVGSRWNLMNNRGAMKIDTADRE